MTTTATAILLACGLSMVVAQAQQPSPGGAEHSGATPRHSPYAAGLPPHAKDYYQIKWGVDSLSVRSTESGLMMRFSYRVVDPAKATVLTDRKASPLLLDPKAGVELVVPTMDKIGQLRQSSTPETGRMYWIVFANKEKHVKAGHRVSVVIGEFRADGLIVQ